MLKTRVYKLLSNFQGDKYVFMRVMIHTAGFFRDRAGSLLRVRGSQRTEVSWESSPAPSFDLYAVTRRDSFSETILRPSGHLGRWATPWSAEEMQVEQHKAVDILPMPDLLTRVSCRKYWKRISAEWSFMSPRRPIRSRD